MRWLALLLLIPLSSACTAPQSTLLAGGTEEVIVNHFTAPAHFSFSKNQVTGIDKFVTNLGYQDGAWAMQTHELGGDCTGQTTYWLYNGTFSEMETIETDGFKRFHAWTGGFGSDAYFDWHGNPIDVPWPTSTWHVSPEGTTWAVPVGGGVAIGGAIETVLATTPDKVSVGDGIVAYWEGQTVHVIGHHKGSWNVPGRIHHLDLHEGALFVAADQALRIQLNGEVEVMPEAVNPFYTNDGYFLASTGYRFHGGIDYYGFSVAGPLLYEFNEVDWAYVMGTTWVDGETLEENLESLPVEEEHKAPGVGLALALPILAFYVRKRIHESCASSC